MKKLYDQKPRKWYMTESGHLFYFDHLDGAYSYCLDIKGNVLHYSASMPCHGPIAVKTADENHS